jgi:hypothetical protein
MDIAWGLNSERPKLCGAPFAIGTKHDGHRMGLELGEPPR